MKAVANSVILILAFAMIPALGQAQTDRFGIADTIYADLAKIDDQHWTITIGFTNDEDVEGISVALKMNAGMTKVVADSAVYTGGRVENFTYTGFRPDTAIQCITLGMLANLGSTDKYLAPGRGRLVTVFVSSREGKAIERLMVDTTTTQPNNTIMAIANPFQHGETGDTIPMDRRKELEIIPAFIVKYIE